MFEVIPYAIRCPDGPNTSSSSHHHNNCVNAETYGEGLVVNKLILEVDSRFSDYAKCNVGVNGTDGHGNPCEDGKYCCYCAIETPDWPYEKETPCNATLGFENISDYFHRFGPCSILNESDPRELAECWEMNAVHKLGGEEYYGGWYSSLDIGCADPLHPTDNCTWRVVSVAAIINRTCHTSQFFNAVATHNASCFDACPGTNTSDFCHVKCFYETAYGPQASVSGGVVTPTTGIAIGDLVTAWLSGFREEGDGGCPRVQAPPTTSSILK